MTPLIIKLPAVMLPVLTVKLEPVIAAPVIAPVALINPPVNTFPPVTFPLALTTAPVIDGVAPCSTVVPPAGLVIVTAVALAEICALPK